MFLVFIIVLFLLRQNRSTLFFLLFYFYCQKCWLAAALGFDDELLIIFTFLHYLII